MPPPTSRIWLLSLCCAGVLTLGAVLLLLASDQHRWDVVVLLLVGLVALLVAIASAPADAPLTPPIPPAVDDDSEPPTVPFHR